MTIWTLSNQESFRSIGDRFKMRRGQVHKIVIEVCKLITENVESYISWPKRSEWQRNLTAFNTLRGQNSFPDVFGCVDGTHILIPGPTDDNSYYNRKGTHSIILQGICDSQLKFINIYCGWPGSTHDAKVWQNCSVYNELCENPENLLPPNSYLLADTAYPLRKFLMVPFKDNGHLTGQQRCFNKKLSSTRVLIENAFARLKGLFRRLKYLNIYTLKYSKYLITATCALHNIAIDDKIEHVNEDNTDEENNINFPENPVQDDNEAVIFRNAIMEKIC